MEGDAEYESLRKHWMNEGYPPRFTYNGYYWQAIWDNAVLFFVCLGLVAQLYEGKSWGV